MRYFIGFLLVLLGAGMLLDAFSVIDFSFSLGTWWPSILMLIALAQLVSRSNSGSYTGPAILFAIGALLQASKLELLPGGFWGTFWPILLIIIGASILLKRRNRKQEWGEQIAAEFRAATADKTFAGSGFTGANPSDRISINCVFSSQEQRATSSAFTGAELNAVFGSIELDLRDAVMSGSQAHIEASSVFASIEIRVPHTWNVVIQGSPILGSIESKVYNVNQNGPTLVVNASAVFGGVEIRS